MALLQNITLRAQYPGHFRGATLTATDGGGARTMIGIRSNTMRTPFASMAGWSAESGFPVGWQFGNGWMPPMSSGGAWPANIGSQTLAGEGDFAGSGQLGLNAEASLSGSGDIASATASLILYAVASLAGVGALTASARATLAAAASLAGSGDINATGGLIQSLSAVASLAGSGDLAGALGALAGLSALVEGEGGATGSTLTASGSMAASINVTGDLLSTANVGAAVWNALATAFNVPGTMGNKLNSASAAGDPWTADLPGTYPAGSAGAIVGALPLIEKLLRNKTVTDPTTGVMTVYDDDGTTVLFTAQMYQDTAGSQTYQGEGAERRERLA